MSSHDTDVAIPIHPNTKVNGSIGGDAGNVNSSRARSVAYRECQIANNGVQGNLQQISFGDPLERGFLGYIL